MNSRVPISAFDYPARSALDTNCKAHDLDTLYVVDTSFFPSASAVSPALPAIANALRVGDHFLDRLRTAASVHP
jgi:choline dehydrogenase-like flavoprotein